MNPQFWWYVARASGIVAWALSSLTVVGGLVLAARVVRGRPTLPWQTDLHKWLGGMTCSFVGVHLAGLVADTYVHFGVADLLVPFASVWKPGAVAWGVVAFWLLVAVEVTSLLRTKLSKRAWKRVHLTSYALWVAGTVHFFTAGSDAGRAAVVSSVATLVAAVFAGTYRLLAPRRPARTLPARSATAPSR